MQIAGITDEFVWSEFLCQTGKHLSCALMMKHSVEFRQDFKAVSPELEIAGDFLQFSITVTDKPERVAEQWKYLEAFASDPFSSYVWIKAWYDAHKDNPNCSPVIISGTDENQKPLFLLPLFLQKTGPFKTLLRPGRTHSACFSGLFSPSCRRMINSRNGEQFWKLVFAQVSWADAIALDGVREVEIRQHNPLGYLPHLNVDNPSFEMLLTGNWESFYRSKIARKARSNVRRCEKRLCELGRLRFKTAETEEDRLRCLRVLLTQKSEQFTRRGIVNPYTRPGITTFYENLVAGVENREIQPLLFTTLVLDEKPLAVIFGMIKGTEFHGLIMSMQDGLLARFSPGRILLHRTLQHLSKIGIRKIDFGVGAARYKEEWVDAEIVRHHVLFPLSLKGRLLVFGIRQASAIKALIKGSGWASEIMRRVRWISMKN